MRETIQINRDSQKVNALGWTVSSLAFALFCTVLLYTVIESDMARQGLTGPLLDPANRWLVILTAAFWLLAAATIAGFVITEPRRRAQREIQIDPGGLELRTHAKWWYRGRRTPLPWDNIQLVHTQYIFMNISTKKVSPRPVLDIYLFREVKALSVFASSTKLLDPPFEAVNPPSWRVRIGGKSREMSAGVQAAARALHQAHPELFSRGSAFF